MGNGPRPRVYHRWRNASARVWPVTLAAALLVGLLAYGLTTTGTDTTLDAAVAKGERPSPPAGSALPRLGEDGTPLARRLQGQGRPGEHLGLVVRPVRSRGPAT